MKNYKIHLYILHMAIRRALGDYSAALRGEEVTCGIRHYIYTAGEGYRLRKPVLAASFRPAEKDILDSIYLSFGTAGIVWWLRNQGVRGITKADLIWYTIQYLTCCKRRISQRKLKNWIGNG